MIIEKEHLKQDIKNFLGDDGINYLQEYKNKGLFFIAWGSSLGGNVGGLVRNYLIGKYGDKIYTKRGFGHFEDLTAEIIFELLK